MDNDPQSRQHSQGGDSLCIGLVAAMLVVTVFLLAGAAFLAWHTASLPFPGLFTEPTLIVKQAGDPSWPGYAAGLQFPDQLVAFEGRELRGTTALMQELEPRRPGEAVTLTAKDSRGTLRDVGLQLVPFPVRGLIEFFLLPYVLGLIYLGMGTWVFVARRHEPAGRAFGLMCAVVALGLGLLFDLYTTHRFPHIWIAALSLAGSVFAHLALVFPQPVRPLERVPALQALIYVPGVILAAINQFTILGVSSA